jgi:anti-sigma factor RsiW
MTTITERHLNDERAQLLTAPESLAAEEHLAACAACRALVASYRTLAEALDQLDRPAPPLDFGAAVALRTAAVDRAQAWSRRLAIGILTAATLLCFAAMAGGGRAAWDAAFSDATGLVETSLILARLGTSVLLPLFRALEVELLLACGLALLSLFAIFSILQQRDRALTPPRGLP